MPSPKAYSAARSRSSAAVSLQPFARPRRLDLACNNYIMRYMPVQAVPTSIRLSQEEKRQIAAAARKRGISVAAFIKRAALGAGIKTPDVSLARLEKMAKTLLDAIEDERDYRLASESWENHLGNKTRLYTGEELKRELGLPG